MGKYDWKKTAWKVVKQIIYVGIAGLAAVYGDNSLYLAIAPALNGLENFIKHIKD